MRRLLVGLLVAAALVTCGSAVAGGDVQAGLQWSIQHTRNPLAPTGELSGGVSCVAAGACTGVGFADNNAGTPITLAEAWNGTSWSIEPTPNPKDAGGSVLNAVSCMGEMLCTAVGSYIDSAGDASTLAEVWNGSSWSIEPTPNPSGSKGSYLHGVSCTPVLLCTAVGSYIDSAGRAATLAEAWNGTSWSIEPTPNPTGSKGSYLHGVSCTSATACTAVGYYEVSADTSFTLAETWDGTSWSPESTPDPKGSTPSQLEGVSCSSATTCTAVGYAYGNRTLAEAWNGASWSIQPTRNPAGAVYSDLDSVSCSSPQACAAVGSGFNTAGSTSSLAESWNGKSWSIGSTAEPAGAESSFLGGLSCSSATGCTAVGSYDNDAGTPVTLAESWNGKSWSIGSTPNPRGTTGSALNGVSCPSPATCAAVGYYDHANGAGTLAESWSGTSWSRRPIPNPQGGRFSVLEGVSCSSATACMAVGYSDDNGGGSTTTLAEAWNGTSWSVVSTPNPRGTAASALLAVSCSSATACAAVGYSDNNTSTYVTLAEVWNGSSWLVRPTPNAKAATFSQLDGVSCSSAAACTAVGWYDNGSGTATLAEVWSGTNWSIRSTPNPRRALFSQLNSDSCASATSCTAVGYTESNSSTPETLAEAWNGTRWSVLPTPNPKGATVSELEGVSCFSASTCTAVGYHDNSAHAYVTLAEVWDGTNWSIRSTPNPKGAMLSALQGVSCTSAMACTAVGYYNNSAGTYVTLAEAYYG